MNISILGSTGSIGTQTLEVIRANADMRVTALAANTDADTLLAQVAEFSPDLVCLYDEASAARMEEALDELLGRHVIEKLPELVSGMDGLIRAAADTDADIVVTAVVGMIGIRPTIAAIRAGKNIALANKETLVTAGHLIMPLAKEKGVRILPVDSEHSAIFQVLEGQDRGGIDKILLTASGGPFRGKKREELLHIRPEDALAHPNWVMGRKITIDSSTLVNKGLEVLEASWLFDVDIDDVKVVVQPQSVIHSMVQFRDGAVLAQLGTPDMKLPIQYALTWPERRHLAGERLDFAALGRITFEDPDTETFPALALAREAGKTGGSMPTVFNASNEVAVERFLSGEIGYLDIAETIRSCMAVHKVIRDPDLDEILETEKEARAHARQFIGHIEEQY